MKSFTVEPSPPAYLSLTDKQWDEKLQRCRELMSPCVLCGRRCGVERFKTSEPAAHDLGDSESVYPRSQLHNSESKPEPEKSVSGRSKPYASGVCRTRDTARVSSFGPHFGEEPPLVGRRGSGTVFFAGCNLKCSFCQNYDIAHFDRGQEVSDEQLSRLMLRVQEMGCHNVNLVSPTHVVPNVLAAVRLAAKQGLNIPLVYNTGGYDSLETIRILEGVVDIYMPDMKYGEPGPAEEFSMAPDYPEVNFTAVKEMHRQVGDLVMGSDAVAVRGLLVRHLVLPGGLAGTKRVMEFIAESISRDAYVNIMAQYRPYHKAVGHPVLGRRITGKEYREALNIARRAGLTRVQAL